MAGPVQFTEKEVTDAIAARFERAGDTPEDAAVFAKLALEGLKEAGMYFKRGNWPGYQMPASGLSLG